MHDDVATDWTPERRETLSKLDQGTVVEGLPFGYFAQLGGAAAVPSLQIKSAGIVPVDLGGKYSPQFAIITSQSCDLVEEDARFPKRPWFMASPVYERADYGERSKLCVDLLGVRYLSRLTGPKFQESVWIADLRIQVPFDKGVLIELPFSNGFADEAGRIAFSFQLAQMYSRPAFPSKVANYVVEALRNWFHQKDARIAEIRRSGLEGFRLRVSAEEPYSVQLLAIVSPARNADDLMQCLHPWYLRAQVDAEKAGLTLLPVEFQTLRAMTAESYLTYHPLALDYILQPKDKSQPQKAATP